jgi:hypothetical protein
LFFDPFTFPALKRRNEEKETKILPSLLRRGLEGRF